MSKRTHAVENCIFELLWMDSFLERYFGYLDFIPHHCFKIYPRIPFDTCLNYSSIVLHNGTLLKNREYFYVLFTTSWCSSSASKRSWEEGNELCGAVHGTLPTVRNKSELEDLVAFTRLSPPADLIEAMFIGVDPQVSLKSQIMSVSQTLEGLRHSSVTHKVKQKFMSIERPKRYKLSIGMGEPCRYSNVFRDRGQPEGVKCSCSVRPDCTVEKSPPISFAEHQVVARWQPSGLPAVGGVAEEIPISYCKNPTHWRLPEKIPLPPSSMLYQRCVHGKGHSGCLAE